MTAPMQKIVAWNAKVGRGDEAFKNSLNGLIGDHHPDAIALQEAHQYLDVIRDRFTDTHYLYVSGQDDTAGKDCPVLVLKKGHEKQDDDGGWGSVQYDTKWTGPSGGTHHGRTWTWVKVKGILVMSFHRCWAGKDINREAFGVEYDKVTDWAARKDKPLLIIGDHNCGVNKTFKGASKLIAQHINGGLAYDKADPGIDYAIKRGIKGTVTHGKAYGSDHGCVIFTQTEPI